MTGATGRLGSRIVEALRARGDEVTVLSRSPERAGAGAVGWQPEQEPAPAAALSGRDGVIHLAGEDIAQRWTDDVKRRLLSSRELGTRNLVAGIAAAEPRPRVLVSASGVDYYGKHGDEELTEQAPAGSGFLASVCVAWEREAARAEEHGVRVARIRNGVVLDRHGGALAKMLPFFKLGLGGPVAGGKQWLSWISAADAVAIYLAALDGERWSGAINGVAPQPARNRDFSRALGRVLRRPAIAPVPGFAVRTLYGEMADLVVRGQRVVPARAQALGFQFRHPDAESALRAALTDA